MYGFSSRQAGVVMLWPAGPVVSCACSTHKEAVYRKNVDLVMCDEAHFMKNGEAQITQAVAGIPAARRLLLSGTPVQVRADLQLEF